MSYIVVVDYDKKANKVVCLQLNEELEKVERVLGTVDLDTLGTKTLKANLKPLNFTIDRNKKASQSRGSFERLHKKGVIVLAEFVSKSGTILGYRLLSLSNGAIGNLKRDEVLNKNKALGDDTPYMQNAMVRNETVCCYPNSPFKQVVVGEQSNTKVTKATTTVKKNDDEKSVFTKEQLAEIKTCRKKGIDSRLIENPELSPKQMRVLWVSKSRGALAEYFANPKMDIDVMKFYGNILYNPRIVKDCSLLLSHPEIGLKRVKEFYKCIQSGIDYSGWLNETSTMIEANRLMVETTQWGRFKKLTDEEIKHLKMQAISKEVW